MITEKDLKLARKSLLYKSNSVESICETLRMIADKVYDYPDEKLKEEVIDLLVTAFAMSKKMNARLIYYHDTYNDTTGKAGKGVCYLPGSKERRQMRAEREKRDAGK